MLLKAFVSILRLLKLFNVTSNVLPVPTIFLKAFALIFKVETSSLPILILTLELLSIFKLSNANEFIVLTLGKFNVEFEKLALVPNKFVLPSPIVLILSSVFNKFVLYNVLSNVNILSLKLSTIGLNGVVVKLDIP